MIQKKAGNWGASGRMGSRHAGERGNRTVATEARPKFLMLDGEIEAFGSKAGRAAYVSLLTKAEKILPHLPRPSGDRR